jgi:chemotaxis protein CheD
MTAPGSRVDVFLNPGEWFAGNATHRIRTVLGSCVSVTLWNAGLRLGAMSHFVLATRDGERPLDGVRGLDLCALDGRYGDEALCLMLHELGRRGVAAPQCEAKIFGGGDMFPGRVAGAAGAAAAVGRRNGEAARRLLQAQGIVIVSEALFGAGHRQVVFDVASGDVWCRQRTPAADLAGEWER